MKKYILIIIINIILGHDFIPSNNLILNQTQLFFKWPQINKAHYYKIYINNHNEYESENNSIILSDLVWGLNYSWYVCGFDENNITTDCYDEMNFSINSLPEDYPNNVNILAYEEEDYHPGFTLLDYESLNFSLVIDNNAQPIWFSNKDNFFGDRILATQFLLNGNIVGFAPGVGYEFDLNSNLLFETPNDYGVHHYVHKTSKDTYFFIDAEIQSHPCPEECDPEYPNTISWQGDRFIEVDKEGNVIWEWNTFDYLSLDEYNPQWVDAWMSQWDFGGNPSFDWTHSNSVYFDEESNIVYISIRNLSRVTAIDYSTKEILWNMGDSDFMQNIYFDNDFGFSHQHSAQVSNENNILFFDNGRDNNPELSRCLEVNVNENNLDAEFVWEYVLPAEMLTLSRGECDRLANGNTLISAGRTGNVLEVNSDNNVVWHLNVKDNNTPVTIYRSERIFNLYPNIFSFEVNNLFGSYADNYQLSNSDSNIEFSIYNKGWSSHTFEYEFLDINQNILYASEIEINDFSTEDLEVPIDEFADDIMFLKVYSKNNPANYQIIMLDNNFYIGDINGDNQLNIQDIVMLINHILNDNEFIESGDLNFDDGINILDVITMVNIIITQ